MRRVVMRSFGPRLFDWVVGVVAVRLAFARVVAQRARRAIHRDGRITRERDAFRATLDALPQAVAIVGPDRRPLLRNRRYTDWFGIDPARSPIADDSGCDGQQLVHCVDGQVREVDCFTATIRAPNGESLGRVISFNEVNREVELARATSGVASDLSHALRSPLASVVGLAELLLAREYPTEERQELLRLILDEGWRLATLIEGAVDPLRGVAPDGSSVCQKSRENPPTPDHS